LRFSLESLGFDVNAICKDILEVEILWAKERLPEYFTFVSTFLSKKKLNNEFFNDIL